MRVNSNQPNHNQSSQQPTRNSTWQEFKTAVNQFINNNHWGQKSQLVLKAVVLTMLAKKYTSSESAVVLGFLGALTFAPLRAPNVEMNQRIQYALLGASLTSYLHKD